MRVTLIALHGLARGSLLVMAAMFLLGHDPTAGNTLAQLRLFAAFFIAPELVARLLRRGFEAQASLSAGKLVVARGAWRTELPLAEVAAVEGWRWPVPVAGAWLRLRNGARWRHGLAGVDAAALQQALQDAGAPAVLAMPTWAQRHAQARAAVRLGRLAHPAARFLAQPLLLAIPAFRLHQHIAYGSPFGELQTFGLTAFLKGFALWWLAWVMAAVALAAVLRGVIEALALAVLWLWPAHAQTGRQLLERLGLGLFYLGPPAWLAWRLLAG